MAGSDFRLPGFPEPIDSPDFYVSKVLRNFAEAGQALGVAVDALVVRLSRPADGGDPDYQFETLDGEDAAAFSGSTHDFLNEDITQTLPADALGEQGYSAEAVKDWLNEINGEGRAGGPLNPILGAGWRDGEPGDPRD